MSTPLLDLTAAFSGRYRIERELGQGGMATVYLARDLRQDGLVALKVLRPELSGVVGAERFAREIAIATRLKHPHILPIHDSGTLAGADGVPVLFYTMPYVAGRSLRSRLNEEAQLPIEEAVSIARQVADALDHAHRQGIVHRDIKPENILLGYPSANRGPTGGWDSALVADFGIARAADAAGERLTQTGLALGTPAYMSPEQAAGTSRLDGRADIYALGCVLYEMLAGEPPFTGPTAQAVLARHAMDRVPSLRTLRPELGAGLARVVRRALAKVPADRYPTARAFADALAAPESERTDESVASGATRYAPGRHRLLVLAGVSALLTAAGALAVVMSRERRTLPVPLDPTSVAVAPFRVSSSDSGMAYLREGIVDLLTTKLGGTLAVRPVDSRTLLNAWRRVGGSAGNSQSGRAMARAVGAEQLVQGEIVSTGTRTTVSATLRQVPDGKETARVTLEGSADSLTPLLDQVAARLLARAAGEPEERLPALAAEPPAALRAYLDGWALVRSGRLPAAIRRFDEALAADSAFALAALGTCRALLDGPGIDNNLGAPQVRLAWRFRDRLNPKDRAYLQVILGPRYPDVSSLPERTKAAEQLTRLYPDNGDAWNLYAIGVCTQQPGQAEIDERCRAAYRRAVSLDSTHALILYNAVLWDAFLWEDTASLRKNLRLFRQRDSTSPGSTVLQWIAATRLGDTIAARRAALSDSLVSTQANGDLGVIWQMLSYYFSEGRGLSDVELVLQRTLTISPTGSQRATLEMMRFQLAVLRGRADGVSPPSWWSEGYRNYERVVGALFADADPAPAAAAAAALEHEVGSPVVGGCCLERFAAAEAALEGGRLATARRARADMERYRKSLKGRAAVFDESRVWPLIVAAQIAAQDQSPEAASRLRQLDSVLVSRGSDWTLSPIYGNLISAHLHEARHEYGAALAALRRRDGGWNSPAQIRYHQEEGRIAAEAGDTAGAIRAYERFVRTRDDVEPRLQPQLQQVRAALAALRHSR